MMKSEPFQGRGIFMDLADSLTAEAGLLPIVLGITGHRQLLHPESLKAQLREEIQKLRTLYTHTPFVAMSALAEGADRLFAQLALELGLELYVPLPMAADIYEADFPDSVDEFRSLCDRAKVVFAIPLVTGVSEDDVRKKGTQRDLQYALAGLYLAQRSHVLFALWDGQAAAGVGGTGQIVAFKQTGRLNDLGHPELVQPLLEFLPGSLLNAPDLGAVCHLQVQRPGQPAHAGPKLQWFNAPWETQPVSHGKKHPHPFASISAYNHALTSRGIAHQAWEEMVGHAKQPVLNAADRELRQMQIRSRSADILANTDVSRVRRAFKIIFWLGAGLVLAHELYADISQNWLLLSAQLLFMALVYGAVMAMRRVSLNSEAIDRRTLSEGLRVQQAWLVAGLPNLVAQNYLGSDSQQLRWVRHALLGASLSCNPSATTQDVQKVRDEWIAEQRDYFAKSIAKRERVVHWLGRCSKFLFVLGLAVAIGVLVTRLAYPSVEHLHHWLLWSDFSLGLLPAMAALCSGYVEFAAYEEDIREHDRMRRLFESALVSLQGVSLADQKSIIRELGVEALHEAAIWAQQHKSRDAKSPVG